MKKFLKNLKAVGIANVVLPVPLFLLTGIWFILWAFAFGMGILGLSTIPGWIIAIGILPLLIAPALEIYGMVCSIVKRRESGALLYFLLSLAGFLGNALLLAGAFYTGSMY